MATREELERWRHAVQSRFPLLGRFIRRRAIAALEARRDDPEVVPVLVEALGVADPKVMNRAGAALRALRDQRAVDALCALWAESREDRLATIITERGYVASQPCRVRALSGLKAGGLELLRQADGELTRELVAALKDKDTRVGGNADAALRALANHAGIDTLCALWADSREERLATIISERGYVASQPWTVRVLSALKCNACLALERADLVPPLVAALTDRDEVIRSRALATLEGLPPGPTRDTLCDAAIEEPPGPAARICVEKGMRPSDHERACLFLFVTRQLDAYF